MTQQNTMTQRNIFHVNDPVHGSIELRGEAICYIIDTEEFQRLRKIKQMGGMCYVYPGANHTRFEHSIGVCYIASELLNYLAMEKRNNVGTTNLFEANVDGVDYVKCVKLAALCHDLGHGPYSHLYDKAIKEKLKGRGNELMDHEYRSALILLTMWEKYPILKELLKQNEVTEIRKMITFSEMCKRKKKEYPSLNDEELLKKLGINLECAYYYEIVANGFTGIDVDKMDYFLRDGHYLGLSTESFSWRRYIQTLKVMEVNGVVRLCSREKEVYQLYELFHIRNQLYRQAICHKTAIIVEDKIEDALIQANESLVLAYKKDMRCVCTNILSEDIVNNVEVFLHLNDSIEDIIFEAELQAFERDKISSSEPKYYFKGNRKELETARNRIREIRKRQIPRFIGEWKYPKGMVSNNEPETKTKVLNAMGEIIRYFLTSVHHISTDKIKIKTAKLDYGMGNEDPVLKHWFYKKGDNPPVQFNKEQLSDILPQEFQDEKLMVYYEEQNVADKVIVHYREIFDKFKVKSQTKEALQSALKELGLPVI